ncbi:hypothetical protein EC396_13135 [Lutibacter sp. HS1-25]|uniref:hypothetical protein n=1 Tax=Lutibacter sp. HS1-25 TaxID=2485000 RepID=UPI001010EA53|nr:hypothetical protein [Lutibacter sp. HS1-25]RXP47067.1 hypothetical protein EC396_13135 [Lutibacter sp. HS1-25]
MKTLTNIDKIAALFLTIIFALGIYFANTDLLFFDKVYTVEDGFVENGSAIFLLSSSILLLTRFFKLFSSKSTTWKIGIAAMALLFFFAAGEEISWGQRIFNIESSAYFLENNAQGETNLHNMVVGGTKINKLIFSQLLTVVLVIYLIITPFLYRKYEWVKNLANLFAVPIVQWYQTIYFLAGTVLLAFIPSNRKWEIYELAFSVIFLLIFLNPLNKSIYQK